MATTGRWGWRRAAAARARNRRPIGPRETVEEFLQKKKKAVEEVDVVGPHGPAPAIGPRRSGHQASLAFLSSATRAFQGDSPCFRLENLWKEVGFILWKGRGIVQVLAELY